MRIAVTGATGFLGWHVRCRAFAMGIESVPISRHALANPARLTQRLRGVDAVVHCAGVNRGTQAELVDGNLGAARALADAVRRCDRPVRVVYAKYRVGDLPDLSSRFQVQLFHTYRSYLFPHRYPIALPCRSDPRGSLVECVRTGVTGGQAFVSTTVPGAVRGDHVHLRKFERYVVVEGRAEIALRRLFTDQVVRFRVSGNRPTVVDMPTLWAHNLTSVGDRPVTTFFWTNELYHAEDADTYPCPVVLPETAP